MSWYGDFNIFLSIKTSFRLQAYKPNKKSVLQNSTQVDDGRVHMYTIKSEIFMEIMNRYPTLRKTFLIRAAVRRAHFMRMLEETKNMYLLDKKEKSTNIALQDFQIAPSEENPTPKIPEMAYTIFKR